MKKLLKFLTKRFPNTPIQIIYTVDNFAGNDKPRVEYRAYVADSSINGLNPFTKVCTTMEELRVAVIEAVIGIKSTK